jgi:hypothetical protein
MFRGKNKEKGKRKRKISELGIVYLTAEKTKRNEPMLVGME